MPDDGKQGSSGEQHTEKIQEQRKHPRKSCNINAEVNDGDNSGSERIRDISLGGVFIETTKTYHVGQDINLSIPFSNLKCNIRIIGKVIRVNSDGIGVEFDVSTIDTG